MAEPDRLPVDRAAITRKFQIPYVRANGEKDTLKIYVTAGVYEDGRLGEIFIKADRKSSLTSGTLSIAAIMISMGLQRGIPVEEIVGKLRYTRFEPSGWTGDPEFPSCTSVFDLIAQWLQKKFIKPELSEDGG